MTIHRWRAFAVLAVATPTITLTGKTVLVTGANRGLGDALVQQAQAAEGGRR